MKKLSACLLSLTASTALTISPALAQDHSQHHDIHSTDTMRQNRNDHMVEGLGSVLAIDIKAGKIGLAHEPMPGIGWPAMKMAFKVAQGVDFSIFEIGDKVQFTLHKVQDGAYPIVEICATNSAVVIEGLCASATPHHDGMQPKKMDHSKMDHSKMNHDQ